MSDQVTHEVRRLLNLAKENLQQERLTSKVVGELSNILKSRVQVMTNKMKLICESDNDYNQVNVIDKKEYQRFEPTKRTATKFENFTALSLVAYGDYIGMIAVMNKRLLNDDELLLLDVSAAMVAQELYSIKDKKNVENMRNEAIVKSALSTLSYSELEAVLHVFEEFKGKEGLLVASKIADKVGITRSVIVNALRKFESAGILETRSLGMKGTFIKIQNEYFMDELKKLRN